MRNSLYPAFLEINYASQFGAHKLRVPTVPLTSDNGWQFDLRGLAASVNVEEAVGDFVGVIKPFFLASTTFIDWTVFNMDTPEGIATPRNSGMLNVAGTSAASGMQNKAVQMTTTFRTDAFGIFKLVFLDVPTSSFDRIATTAGYAQLAALVSYVTADVTFLAGRDGGRPNTFLQVSTTLNERLRRSYRMN